MGPELVVTSWIVAREVPGPPAIYYALVQVKLIMIHAQRYRLRLRSISQSIGEWSKEFIKNPKGLSPL